MQQTSDLYKTLLDDPAHIKETRVQIGETWYGEGSIVTLSTSEPLFSGDTVSFGGAVAREIALSGFFPDSIPRRAKITVQVRLVLGSQVSEWLPKGVFYIDTRSRDQVTGVTTIHGFDAILMGEQEWIPADSDVFPMSMEDAVKKTAAALKLEIDPRTTFKTGKAYMVDHPAAEPEVDEETGETDVRTQSGVTIRQLWRWVAAAMGGNFITNDLGQLRLIPLNALPASTAYLVNEDGDPITFGGNRLLMGTSFAAGNAVSGDKVFVGQRATSAEVFPALQPISRIILKVDNNSAYVSGSDTGMTMEVSCPYGSQQMAKDLLAQLKDYAYQPMAAEDALIDPAAELGDGVTVNGVYTILAQKDTTFDLFCAADIAAPGKPELESEFRFTSQQQAEYNYELAKTRSLISKTAEQIRLEIVGVEEEMSYIQLDLDKITSRVQDAEGNISTLEQTAASLRSDIEGKIDGEAAQSLIDQSLEDITFEVSNGATSSTIKLMAGEAEIDSAKIEFTGVVTFNALSGSPGTGQTTINGGWLKGETIEGATIKGGVFRDTEGVGQLDLSLEAYGDSLPSLLFTDTKNNVDLFAVYPLNVDSTSAGLTILGAPVLLAEKVEGVNLNQIVPYGTWNFRVADLVDFSEATVDFGGQTLDDLNIDPSDISLSMIGDETCYVEATDRVWVGNHMYPDAPDEYNCGNANFPWAMVYSTNGMCETSDRNKKKDISYNLDEMDGFFDGLRPGKYRMKNGKSGRRHYGFVAQDVKDDLDKHGISTKDFGGYVEDKGADGNPILGLRYSEFIPLLVDQVQKLKARVAKLEGGVKA